MIIKAKVLRLSDNINTDLIIAGRYKFSITDIKELAKHILEDIDPDFYKKIEYKKSIIVAGKNFGLGSSREQAPLVIKESGILAVVAESFARIFYRNAFNVGLPLIEMDTSKIREKDYVVIDLGRGIFKDISQNFECRIKPLPCFMQKLIKEGGLINYINKYKGLKL